MLIAYEQLTAEGYVVADRQGTRVAPLSAAATSAARQAEPPQPAPFTAARLGRIASTRVPNDGALPLTPGTPALNQFPVNAWRRAQDRALQAAPSATLGYGHPMASRRCAPPSPNTCASRAGCAAMPRMWSSPRAPRARWRCACSC